MADSLFDESLAAVVEAVLRRTEVDRELREASLSSEEVVSDVLADQYFRARAGNEYKEIFDRAAELDEHARDKPGWWQPGWRPNPKQWVALIFALLFVVGVAVIVFSILLGWPWPLAVLLVVAMVYFDPVTQRILRVALPETTSSRLEWERRRLLLWLGISFLRYDWKEAVREELVLPAVREKINDRRTPTFDTKLTIRDASGLRSTEDLAFVIPTESVKAILRELRRLKTGAIALAGRRGVGKTTLIKAVEAKMLHWDDDLWPLTIVASAPAKYEPRDFVLHLHAIACRKVIDLVESLESGSKEGSDPDKWSELYRRTRAQKKITQYADRFIVTIGKILFCISVACLLWYDVRTIGLDFPRDIAGAVAWFRQHGLSVAPPVFYAIPWEHTAAVAVLAAGMLIVLLSLVSGVLLIARSIMARFLLWLVKYLLHWWNYSTIRIAAARAVVSLFSFLNLDRWTPRLSLSTPELRPFVRRQNHQVQVHNSLMTLRVLAEKKLQRIRFLQTHTVGWSGKLNASTTAGFGVQRSTQRAEQPLTHPEVVEELRRFLARAAEVLRRNVMASGIIVAIDELDKMVSPDQAHEFINEIKGTFNVPDCVFIVSVSEDALTAFERRGIPVRDALDSAFAVMIDVGQFSPNESRQWLSRRVIGLPEPFICLCHCLSGGIPRELARTAAELSDPDESLLDLDLPFVARQLVAEDIQRKLRAFSRATQKFDTSRDVSQFVVTLNTATSFSEQFDLDSLAVELLPRNDSRSVAESPDFALRWEAASYVYFNATIVAVFAEQFTGEDLISLIKDHDVADELAVARQSLGVSPQLTWELLSRFRASYGITVMSPPETGE